MNERVIETLTELTAINSPSGSAERAIDYVKKRVELSGYTTHNYSSDASAALSAGADVKHGLFGAGIESSHALERTHIDSIKAAQAFLEAYCFSELV